MAPLPTALAVAPGDPTVNSKWRLDVDTAFDGTNGSTVTSEWAQLRGMADFTPGLDNTVQDASDYDSNGWGKDVVTFRKWKGEATVNRNEYADAYDPAQEFLRAAADATDLVHVRWYERGVTAGEAYEGLAIVQWEPQGGAPSGLSSVKVTLLGQGPRVAITGPVTP